MPQGARRSLASRRMLRRRRSWTGAYWSIPSTGSGQALRGRFAAPQRLCWRSSAFWAPWLFVPQDGVEDGEEFTGRGDGDEHFGLAGVDEALAKSLEDRIVTAGGEACEKKGGAHGLAAAGDHGFALPLAGLAGGRGGARAGFGAACLR